MLLCSNMCYRSWKTYAYSIPTTTFPQLTLLGFHVADVIKWHFLEQRQMCSALHPELQIYTHGNEVLEEWHYSGNKGQKVSGAWGAEQAALNVTQTPVHIWATTERAAWGSQFTGTCGVLCATKNNRLFSPDVENTVDQYSCHIINLLTSCFKA